MTGTCQKDTGVSLKGTHLPFLNTDKSKFPVPFTKYQTHPVLVKISNCYFFANDSFTLILVLSPWRWHLLIDFFQIIEIWGTCNSIQSRANLASLDPPTNHPTKAQTLKQVLLSKRRPSLKYTTVCASFLITKVLNLMCSTTCVFLVFFSQRALTVPKNICLMKKERIILWIQWSTHNDISVNDRGPDNGPIKLWWSCKIPVS